MNTLVPRLFVIILLQVQRVDGVIFLEPKFSPGQHKDDRIDVDNLDESEGRKELNNFRCNVLPVVRYFKEQEILHVVNICVYIAKMRLLN